MTRLILETVLHTVIVPGIVVVAVPAVLLWSGMETSIVASTLVRTVGVLLIVAGVGVGLWCTGHFVVSGRGTPNPLDPPQFLVQAGPCQVVRNPMFVSVATILAGEALATSSAALVV